MKPDCNCGFDHWPHPCKKESEPAISIGSTLRIITADDMIAEANRNYDLGLRRGREEIMERAASVTAEVLRVVSSEGYEEEDWNQVKAAVIRGMKTPI